MRLGVTGHQSASTTAKALLARAALVDRQVEAAVRTSTRQLHSNVVAHAPQDEGDYRDSIGIRFGRRAGTFFGEVGTDAPQARRLEFGFHGIDADGRRYNNPPQPHWRPAARAIEPVFAGQMRAVAVRTFAR